MKKIILFTIILGLMCPSVFADNMAYFNKDGEIILTWDAENKTSPLVVWVTKGDETIFANMMTAEEYAGGELVISNENINDGDTVTVEYEGCISYAEDITYDRKTLLFEDLAQKLKNAKETDTLETIMEYAELLNKETAEKLRDLSEEEQSKTEEALVNGQFSDFDGIEEIINTAYEEILKDRKDKEDKKNNSSSSSSSSSSAGGGGSVSVPFTSVSVVVPQPENKYEYEEPVCEFKDIENVKWAQESINKLYKKGVISGTDKETFSPDENVTRTQFVKMLVCAFDVLNEKAVSKFTDVSEKSWSYPYVSSAYEAELVKGISEKYFGADESITRQDAAVMVYRFMKKYAITFDNVKSNDFADKSEIADYALEAVDYMSANSIINGVGDGRFDPNGVCTRAMAAKIICAAAYWEE